MANYVVTLTFEVEMDTAQHAAAFFLEELFEGPSWGDKKLEVRNEIGEIELSAGEDAINGAFYRNMK